MPVSDRALLFQIATFDVFDIFVDSRGQHRVHNAISRLIAVAETVLVGSIGLQVEVLVLGASGGTDRAGVLGREDFARYANVDCPRLSASTPRRRPWYRCLVVGLLEGGLRRGLSFRLKRDIIRLSHYCAVRAACYLVKLLSRLVVILSGLLRSGFHLFLYGLLAVVSDRRDGFRVVRPRVLLPPLGLTHRVAMLPTELGLVTRFAMGRLLRRFLNLSRGLEFNLISLNLLVLEDFAELLLVLLVRELNDLAPDPNQVSLR